VRRDEAGVSVQTAAGSERFDHLVLACHSDQALRILGTGASGPERALLGAVRYQPNRALLHHDPLLLPKRRAVWSAWNYSAGAGEPGAQPVSVSYLINRLQPLPVRTPVVVSLNPHLEPRPDYRLAEFDYDHPIFDRAAIDAQQRLPQLQGRLRTWFCGAWTGYGFHEDGLRSALIVTAALGVRAPWLQGEAPAAVAALRAA
jgi:predicted NAD/FAD-binding protein